VSPVTRICRVLTNDERRGLWAARYYAGGHHRDAQTLATRTVETRAKRSSPRYAFDDVPTSALPSWHPDSLRYAGP